MKTPKQEKICGLRVARHPRLAITVLRLHFSADPSKDEAWAAEQRRNSVSEAAYQQELEVNFESYSGQLLLPEFDPEVNVIEPFPIPHSWTRYMCLDPHIRVPHAFLWLAVSPYDEWVVYRDLWPSKIYGQPGHTPEDDKLLSIDEYCESVHFLEGPEVDMFGPNGYADNQGKREKIYVRIMDPAGKAFASERHQGKEGALSFWDVYRDCRRADGTHIGLYCEAAKKDFSAARDIVGRRLRPSKMVDAEGESQRSLLRVFNTCRETIYEMKSCRFPVLTAAQAATKDPIAVPLPLRKHLVDCLFYIAINSPRYIEHVQPKEPQRIYEGINW